MQVVESSSLVSVLFREAFIHPYISFFHLLVNGFSVIVLTYDSMVTVLGINGTRNAGKCTRLRLVKFTSYIAHAIIPNNTADHAIIYNKLIRELFMCVWSRSNFFLFGHDITYNVR